MPDHTSSMAAHAIWQWAMGDGHVESALPKALKKFYAPLPVSGTKTSGGMRFYSGTIAYYVDPNQLGSYIAL